MKKFKNVFLVGVILLTLTACVAEPVATSSAVQIPDVLKLALNGLILAGITAGLQVLFEQFKLDLRGFGVGISVAVGEFVLLQLQGVIDVIPVQYDMLVGIVLNIIVVILTGLGYVRLVVQRERAAQMLKLPEKFR